MTTIRIQSGAYLDLRDPSPDLICIEDIACGLSKICRFNGQIERFYSVAEHSVHCADLALEDGYGPETVFAVFMHDAAEAYVGDVTRPLKQLLTDFDEIEARVFRAIQKRFGFLQEPGSLNEIITTKIVTEIDNTMLHAERRRLFPPDQTQWSREESARSVDVPCYCWPHRKAFQRFMETFERLQEMRA